MASIHRVTLKSKRNGRPVVAYKVRWREDGRQPSRVFPTESEARTFKAQVELGLEVAATPEFAEPAPVVTLEDARTSFLASRRVSRAATAKEASLVRRLEPLASRPVAELTPSDVRAFVASLVDEGLAAETVSAILRTLRAILDVAVEDGHAASNVAARVRPPTIRRPPIDEGDVYTADEARALVAHTTAEHRAMMAVLAFLGCRFSEAAGATRGDLDLEAGRLRVGRQVAEEVAGSIELRPGGKTRGSDRVIPLPAAVRVELEAHLERTPRLPGALLFSTSNGTPVSRTNFARRVYRDAVEAAEAKEQLEDRGITMRNLRHTAASLMLAAGLSPLEVAQRLGHSKPSTTLDVYSRLLPGGEDTATGKLDRLLG